MKKRFVALMLCILIVGGTVSALAEMPFKYTGDETVIFENWTGYGKSSGKSWHLTWSNQNLSSRNRAVVRIHAGYDAASASWVYSSASTSYHPYNPGFGYGNRDVQMRGRMDNRDSGKINVSGTFYN